MTGPQYIVLNGTQIEISQIIDGNAEPRTEFENHALTFCRDWLSGKSHFSLTTSGSTGTPKSITANREQMIASATSTAAFLNLQHNFNALVCLDTRYIAGMMMLVRCFETGMNPIIVEPSVNPLSEIGNQKIDFAAFVPMQVDHMINECPEQLDQIQKIIIGGAHLNKELLKEIAKLKTTVYETYGMTETLSHVALKKLNGNNSDPYFTALPGVSFEIDGRGCLVVHAPYLSSPFVTNDVVELVNQKQFNWIGRWDHIINSGGVKINPEKIETELQPLMESVGIPNRFIIAGFSDQKLGEKVCLILEGKSPSEEIINKLKELMDRHIHKYEQPREIFFTDQFVETATGKINRRATINLFPV